MDWLVVDVPVDSSGCDRGEARAPVALRAAGLVARLQARDGGSVDALVRDPVRDPVSGVIGAAAIRRATANIAAALRAVPSDVRPLLIGGDCTLLLGDCTLLLGVFTALPRGTALWFVDGHPDFLDATTSPTGEAADMDLSILSGHGPAGILEQATRLVDPGLVTLIGHRSPVDDVARVELTRVDPAIRQMTAGQVRVTGPAVAGSEIAGQEDAPVWLHLDLDVLDERDLPAVSYPQPDGLGWDDLVALTEPMLASGRVRGVSVADFNPDRDPDGTYAARVVDFLARLLG